MTSTVDLDSQMRDILTSARVIAVVGLSDDRSRPSYRVAHYLRRVGYTVYPVNPTIDSVDGQPSYASLADIPVPVDIVNVFRRPEFLSQVVDDALAIGAPVVWAQLGIVDEAAAEKGRSAGMQIIMDHCIRAEHWRLIRETD
jgi:uncharacterized protein